MTEQATTVERQPIEPRIAHALCPYCHPADPAPGTEVVRWCGAVVPIGEQARPVSDLPESPASDLCPACTTLGSQCVTCGATASLLGVLPPTKD